MCVALPWQVATLWRLNVVRRLSSAAKLGLVAVLGAAVLAGPIYMLERSRRPWFPITHWLNCGCTGTRAMAARGEKFGGKSTRQELSDR